MSSTNLSEIGLTFDHRWLQAINNGFLKCWNIAVPPQEWDVPKRAHVSVLGARSVPAVVSEDPVASTELEGEHPAVNHESESLIVQSLNVAEDHER